MKKRQLKIQLFLHTQSESYDMDEYSASQKKLKAALKGIPGNEILDFLKKHNDSEDMQDSDDEACSHDPFGGPLSQTQ